MGKEEESCHGVEVIAAKLCRSGLAIWWSVCATSKLFEPKVIGISHTHTHMHTRERVPLQSACRVACGPTVGAAPAYRQSSLYSRKSVVHCLGQKLWSVDACVRHMQTLWGVHFKWN